MAEEKLTTVQIDQETLRMLGMLAVAYERSKTAQMRYMVKREYGELERLKLLPADMSADDCGMQTINE